MNITDKLKKIMQNEGLSQSALARIAGVTEGSVTGWMNGAKPRRKAIMQIAASLDYETWSLENDKMELRKCPPMPKLEKNEFNKDIMNKIPYAIFNGDAAIDSVELLYNVSFDENTRILLNIIQRNNSYFDYNTAIEYAKKHNNMPLATVLLFFDKLSYSSCISINTTTNEFSIDGIKEEK